MSNKKAFQFWKAFFILLNAFIHTLSKQNHAAEQAQ